MLSSGASLFDLQLANLVVVINVLAMTSTTPLVLQGTEVHAPGTVHAGGIEARATQYANLSGSKSVAGRIDATVGGNGSSNSLLILDAINRGLERHKKKASAKPLQVCRFVCHPSLDRRIAITHRRIAITRRRIAITHRRWT